MRPFLVFVACGLLAHVPLASAQDPYEIAADFGTTTARFPAAGLLLASDGNYYGTTYLGGDNGLGTVFRMTPEGVLTILHSFDGSDGANPYAPLIEGDDFDLYGTTLPQASGTGTIFKMTKQGAFTLIHALAAPDPSGCHPEGQGLYAPLAKGTDGLYGVAAGNCGGIPFFRVSYSGTFTVVGYVPDTATTSGLARGTDGYFYGTTEGGNASNLGMVYRISEAGVFQKLHELTRAEGFAHTGELIQAKDGSFYGTARAGGAYSLPAGNFEGGTIFKFTPGADEATSVYRTLYSFVEDDPAGSEPYAGLVQGSDGLLYGTTLRTGANATTVGGPGGAIFSITTNGSLTPLLAFDAARGYQPMGELIQPSPGQVLGTTAFGGSGLNAGVIFRYTFGNATSTSVTASPTASVFGQPVTLTADVSSVSGTPTGQVEFFDGATSLGKSSLSGGTATAATSALGVGSHALSASYPGDGTFLTSSSATVSLAVSKAQTTTTLASSPNPSKPKQLVTLSATVTPRAPGTGAPTGQVKFVDGKKTLGLVALVNGVAALQIGFNSMGQHVIKASYAGDTHFVGSDAAAFTQTVKK